MCLYACLVVGNGGGVGCAGRDGGGKLGGATAGSEEFQDFTILCCFQGIIWWVLGPEVSGEKKLGMDCDSDEDQKLSEEGWL